MADETIPHDQFRRAELRVGSVAVAERVQGSEKLIRLEVDLGGEMRQIVAGIGLSYEPEALLGRQIVIVANLEPRMLMGLESRGMLLAADSHAGPVIITPERTVSVGAPVQ